MTQSTPAPVSPMALTTPDAAQAGFGEQSIQWCLLSHTNIGKTTLTRTLLGGDVGEVADGAHVTVESQRHLLQSTPGGDELWLWDTPGFGDSLRLYQRLAQQGNPLGWFLSNVWDRWRDKPFYLSQRALRAARDHADVMLYLVNAAEDPADAGYWHSEMGILQWLDKPVIVLLNQVGAETSPAQAAADLARWREAVTPWRGVVREVLVLDAFTRSWWHERRMMQSIAPLLPSAKQPAYARLLAERERAQTMREAESLQALAGQLLASAALREQPDAGQDKLLGRVWNRLKDGVAQSARLGRDAGDEERAPPAVKAAMERLLEQIRQADARATSQLLQIHALDGEAASQIQRQLQGQLSVSTPIDAQSAGLWGALATGAATGLGADLAAGGLTLGAGALIGALVGGLGFAGAALGVNRMFDQERQRVELSPAYLDELAALALLKYLVISHFGRGRGRYRGQQAPGQWAEAVRAAIEPDAAQWLKLWRQTRSSEEERPPAAMLQAGAEQLLRQALARAMGRLYPGLEQRMDTLEPSQFHYPGE